MLFQKIIEYASSVIKMVLIISISIACQKVINVDLNVAAPRMVIEGLITDREGPYVVTVSKSGSFFGETQLPRVSDALVVIADNTGIIDTLREKEPGVYLTGKLEGVPGRTYTLTVVSGKIKYTGTSTMHVKVAIDSLSVEKSLSRFGFGNGKNNDNVDVHCFFNDPPEKNFYRIKTYINDTTLGSTYRLYDDQYTNGEETDVRAGRASAHDSVRIELISLDKSTYEYYRTLSDLLRQNPFFGSTPANPNTNLSNGALGYFGTCAIASKTIVVRDSPFNSVQ